MARCHVTVPATAPTIDPTQVGAMPFFFTGSILPAFDAQSELKLGLQYIPYQGEGVLNRDYEILHSEDDALVTTNGTGNAPVVGLTDVYPYNRELPIITMLPAQQAWNDAGPGERRRGQLLRQQLRGDARRQRGAHVRRPAAHERLHPADQQGHPQDHHGSRRPASAAGVRRPRTSASR